MFSGVVSCFGLLVGGGVGVLLFFFERKDDFREELPLPRFDLGPTVLHSSLIVGRCSSVRVSYYRVGNAPYVSATACRCLPSIRSVETGS